MLPRIIQKMLEDEAPRLVSVGRSTLHSHADLNFPFFLMFEAAQWGRHLTFAAEYKLVA